MDQDQHRSSQTDGTFAWGADVCTDGARPTHYGARLGCALTALLHAEGACIKQLKKRSVIVSEGSKQPDLTAVLSGVVKVSTSLRDGRTQILGLRFPGEFISMRGLAEPSFASVEVVEDVTLLILSDAKAVRLRRENPQFNIDMGLHVDREIACMQAHLVTLGRRLPIERLAALLIEFNDRGLGVEGDRENVRIPLTRDEIGDYIGLNSETVSRQFTHLKTAGHIRLVSPSRVLVKNWHALRQLSNGESFAAGA